MTKATQCLFGLSAVPGAALVPNLFEHTHPQQDVATERNKTFSDITLVMYVRSNFQINQSAGWGFSPRAMPITN